MTCHHEETMNQQRHEVLPLEVGLQGRNRGGAVVEVPPYLEQRLDAGQHQALALWGGLFELWGVPGQQFETPWQELDLRASPHARPPDLQQVV